MILETNDYYELTTRHFSPFVVQSFCCHFARKRLVNSHMRDHELKKSRVEKQRRFQAILISRLMEPSASDAAPQPAAEPADSTS